MLAFWVILLLGRLYAYRVGSKAFTVTILLSTYMFAHTCLFVVVLLECGNVMHVTAP